MLLFTSLKTLSKIPAGKSVKSAVEEKCRVYEKGCVAI